MRRALVLGVVLVVGAGGALEAQESPPLARVLDSLAVSWQRGDARSVVTLAAGTGLTLSVTPEPVGPLAPRQAAALLRRIFEERETVSIELGMEHVVGGVPPRAFGELTWVHRARGTTMPERTVIFLALVRDDDAWRVTEIRFLR
ncbi:MAG: hypothetical protein ACODAE_09155 [Gemmatimonadota bacterium]